MFPKTDKALAEMYETQKHVCARLDALEAKIREIEARLDNLNYDASLNDDWFERDPMEVFGQWAEEHGYDLNLAEDRRRATDEYYLEVS